MWENEIWFVKWEKETVCPYEIMLTLFFSASNPSMVTFYIRKHALASSILNWIRENELIYSPKGKCWRIEALQIEYENFPIGSWISDLVPSWLCDLENGRNFNWWMLTERSRSLGFCLGVFLWYFPVWTLVPGCGEGSSFLLPYSSFRMILPKINKSIQRNLWNH